MHTRNYIWVFLDGGRRKRKVAAERETELPKKLRILDEEEEPAKVLILQVPGVEYGNCTLCLLVDILLCV